MADEETWLDSIHRALERLFSVEFEAEDLSKAFSRLGNVDVAKELADIALCIRGIRDEIRLAIGKHLKEDISKGMEEGVLLVKAALAGITVGEDRE